MKPHLIQGKENGAIFDVDQAERELLIAPQLSKSMYDYIVELQTAANAVGTSLSIWEVLACIFLNKSLHAIWILVDTLQFFAFMSAWQIAYEPVTRAILRELRRVVLAEYMDDLEIGKKFLEWLGINPAEEVVGERSGSSRLGTNSLYENFGATIMVIILLFMLLILIVVGFVKCARRLSMKCRERITDCKRRIFFNPLIRFTYLNSLKFNIVAMGTISGLNEGPSEIIQAVLILLTFNLLPILYSCILKKKPEMLQEEEFKEIVGTLYSGMAIPEFEFSILGRDKPLTWMKPAIFMFKRTLFAISTVALFDYPALQMIATQVQVMAYIIFITRDNLFGSKLMQAVEIFTEMLFMMALLLLQQFMRDLPSQSPAQVRNFFIAVLVLLIAGNVAYAITVYKINKKEATHKKKLLEKRLFVFK